jgi:RNA polymerase sigma factor (sigma-70 family)
MNDIRIEDHMTQIRKMAVRALANMNNRFGYTMEDMIGEGILVFYKDALPGFTRKGYCGPKACFKTYLTVCLRNHYFGLMKSSFRKAVNDDIFDERDRQTREDPKLVYMRRRQEATRELPPYERASFNIVIDEIKQELDERETVYLQMVISENPRKDIRKTLGVSSVTERKILKSLQRKMAVLVQ